MSYLDEIAGKVRAEVPTDLLPDEDDLDQLFRLYAVLVRAKGQATTNADVHDAWAAWMLGRGDNHESVKPYEQLDGETKQQDEPFLRAIRTVAESTR
jgi:hypothetical protein